MTTLYQVPVLNSYQRSVVRHAARGTRIVATRGAWGCG